MSNARPTIVRFFLEPTEDEELACHFCKGKRCDQQYSLSGNGETRIIGVHNKCVDEHDERFTGPRD